jgi:hypothetical protein
VPEHGQLGRQRRFRHRRGEQSGQEHLAVGNDLGISVDGVDGGNVITKNVSLGNRTHDLSDVNAGCGTNSWQKNKFGTSDADGVPNPTCIQ